MPLSSEVSIGLILLSLEKMKPNVKNTCEEPKRMYDILSAPNF